MLRILVHNKNSSTYNAMNVKEDGQAGCTSKVYIMSNTEKCTYIKGENDLE